MKRPAAGKAAAKRRHERALVASEGLAAILGDGVAVLMAKASRELRARAMAAASPPLVSSGAVFGVENLPGLVAELLDAHGIAMPAIQTAGLWDDALWEMTLADIEAFLASFIIEELETEFALVVVSEQPLVRDVVVSHVSMIESWGDELKSTVRAVTEKGFREAQSVKQVADALRDAGIASERRAVTIARTELISASNAASYRATGAVSEPGDRKRWLATSDERTRRDHRDADGQVVQWDEPFTVGGSKMMHPGDRSAPLRQTVQCRCTYILVPGD